MRRPDNICGIGAGNQMLGKFPQKNFLILKAAQNSLKTENFIETSPQTTKTTFKTSSMPPQSFPQSELLKISKSLNRRNSPPSKAAQISIQKILNHTKIEVSSQTKKQNRSSNIM